MQRDLARSSVLEGVSPGLPQSNNHPAVPGAHRKRSVAQVLLVEPDRQLGINGGGGERYRFV